jgi:hypothetical protein
MELLFKPKKIDLPSKLILIPKFWDRNYFEKLKKDALASFEIVQSEFLFFDEYTLVEGFLGYPHILTTLEFINGVKEKEIFFLGTAGSMNEEIAGPMPLEVTRIYPSAIFNDFCDEDFFELKSLSSCDFRKAAGVSVDIIQRETVPWLKEQKSKGIDFVEMEIFPLRVYLEKPFHAVVVTSDLLKEGGIEIFPDKKLLQREFVRAYEFIVKAIHG